MDMALANKGAVYCYDAGLSSNDEDDKQASPSPPDWPLEQQEPQPIDREQQQIVFDLQGPDKAAHGEVDIKEEDHLDELVASKMLRKHHRMAHLPFSRMQAMARAGLLPHVFATCHEPLCTACLYGKATRRPWRTKGTITQGTLRRATYAGHCVAVDQCESPTPGLVAQIKGIPTKKRYTSATVFVDMFSDFSFVHFQYTTNAKETLEAKLAFECYAKSHGVNVRAYHADNG